MTDNDCDREAGLWSNHGDTEGASEGLATVTQSERSAQFIDDPLGDAFETRKEL